MNLFSKIKKPADTGLAARTPPGQTLTKGFPVLTYGATPRLEQREWTCKLFGLGIREITFTWQDLMAMPQTSVVCDIHCVTTWSKLDMKWAGVKFSDFLKAAEARGFVMPSNATHVMQHSTGGYTTNTPLADLMDENVLLAHTYDGAPLETDHGGPVRFVLPRLYFWKSAKWLNGFELMSEDRLGFWERFGYHQYGDPWKEQRYSEKK